MSREKSYAPVASYEQLQQAEADINGAATVADIREATRQHGAKVGYKAFCYLLTGKMTPEGMKPDEAAGGEEAGRGGGPGRCPPSRWSDSRSARNLPPHSGRTPGPSTGETGDKVITARNP